MNHKLHNAILRKYNISNFTNMPRTENILCSLVFVMNQLD